MSLSPRQTKGSFGTMTAAGDQENGCGNGWMDGWKNWATLTKLLAKNYISNGIVLTHILTGSVLPGPKMLANILKATKNS